MNFFQVHPLLVEFCSLFLLNKKLWVRRHSQLAGYQSGGVFHSRRHHLVPCQVSASTTWQFSSSRLEKILFSWPSRGSDSPPHVQSCPHPGGGGVRVCTPEVGRLGAILECYLCLFLISYKDIWKVTNRCFIIDETPIFSNNYIQKYSLDACFKSVFTIEQNHRTSIPFLAKQWVCYLSLMWL